MPEFEKTLILGLDIGSSSVRGALFDMHGKMIRSTFVQNERRMKATRDGGAEINADKAVRQVISAIDEVIERSKKVCGEITKIASCAFWHSLIGTDEKEKPTTPVFSWADNRSRNYVSVLRKRFDEKETHNHTGCRFHSSYWPAKLMWLRKEFPDVWSVTARWLSFSDYLALRFCGSAVSSISMASGTGVFDIRKYEWDADLTRYLKLRQRAMPQIAASDDVALPLLPKWRKRWPRLAKAKWFPSVADGAANNIGSGCIDASRAALMIGTSGAMRVILEGSPPKRIPPGLFCYRLDRKRVVLGGALSDGGGLYDWLKSNLRIDISDAGIGKEILRRGPDTHGLTFLPFVAGERSTGYNESASGLIHGLTLAHDAIDILQAAMESVAYRFAEILKQIESISTVREIVASGGALSQSPVWRGIIVEVLGRDLELSPEPEASLLGAVLLTLSTTGKIDLTDEFSAKRNTKVLFHPELHSIYKEARKQHQNTYEATLHSHQ